MVHVATDINEHVALIAMCSVMFSAERTSAGARKKDIRNITNPKEANLGDVRFRILIATHAIKVNKAEHINRFA